MAIQESTKDLSYMIILADESTALESLGSVSLTNTGEHDTSEIFCQENIQTPNPFSIFTIIIF